MPCLAQRIGIVPLRTPRVLFVGKNASGHRLGWLFFSTAALAAAIVWYVIAAAGSPDLPGGSSLPGFWLGVAAAGIILFELLLTFRKRLRGTARWLGPTGWWMRAHVWLGILCVPVAFLHTGFRFGGTFTTVLMVFFLLAIASGLFGLILQHLLPRALLEQVPGETLFAQIEHVMAGCVERAERHLHVLCGPAKNDADAALVQALEEAGSAYRSPSAESTMLRSMAEAVPLTAAGARRVPGSEVLREFFDAELRDYLLCGVYGGSPLRSLHTARQRFNDLRARMPTAASDTVDSLDRLCELRRQLDRQAVLHRRLHAWLWFHLPLSWALLLLLVIHVITAVKYW
jgi:hypothetical protein